MRVPYTSFVCITLWCVFLLSSIAEEIVALNGEVIHEATIPADFTSVSNATSTIEVNAILGSESIEPEANIVDTTPATSSNDKEIVEELSNQIPTGFSSTEILLDQLDAAEAEISSLKKETSVINVSLAEKVAENQNLHEKLALLTAELEQFHAVVSSLNETLNSFEATNEAHLMAISNLDITHKEEIAKLNDKIMVAERNASLYENRAQFAKNEKVIARLSQENCMLELEATRHTNMDEVIALKAEIVALKRASSTTVCTSTSSVVAPSKDRLRATDSDSSSDKVGRCDASQCFHTFLSKYVFFWAEEHNKDTQASQPSAPRDVSANTYKSKSTSQQSIDMTAAAWTAPSATAGGPQQSTSRIRAGTESPEGILPQAIIFYSTQSYRWAVDAYFTYIHPFAVNLITWELKLIAGVCALFMHAVTVLWEEVLRPFLSTTLLPLVYQVYKHQLLPIWSASLYPWYHTHLEGFVNHYATSIAATWESQYEPWYDRNVVDYTDLLFGRLHYAAYFTMRFFTDGDLMDNLSQVLVFMQGFVPGVIEQLSSIPAIREHLGDNYCDTVVTVGVYGSVALFLYFMRRFIMGLISLALIIVLSPFLLLIYILAKLARKIFPKKKAAKRTGAKMQSGASGVGGGVGKVSTSLRATKIIPKVTSSGDGVNVNGSRSYAASVSASASTSAVVESSKSTTLIPAVVSASHQHPSNFRDIPASASGPPPRAPPTATSTTSSSYLHSHNSSNNNNNNKIPSPSEEWEGGHNL